MSVSLSDGINSSCTALTIVIIGMLMKRVGVLGESDSVCLSKAIVNLSTPALIIQVF